jgi:dihydroorotate dehydrogenase (NAD+) catalytic subunit
MVWELREAVQVPIIGLGGIASAEDALEFLMAGATAIQVGSATFAHPPAMNEIIIGIETYMRRRKIFTLSRLSIRN